MLYSLYRKLGGYGDQFGWVQKISPSTRVRTPNCPACGDSLYKVHYPGQQISTTFFTKTRQNDDDDDGGDDDDDDDDNNRCVKQRSMPQGSKNEDVRHSLLINYIYHTKDLYIVPVVFIHTNLQNPSNNVSLVQ